MAKCTPAKKDPPEPVLCDNTHGFEIHIQCIKVTWEADETVPQQTSLDYGEHYVFWRFVHPYFGQIETVPTRLLWQSQNTIANCKADINLFVRTDVALFWRNMKTQPVLVYFCRKGKIFDEFIGVNFLNFGALQPHHKPENMKGSDSSDGGEDRKVPKAVWEFKVPVRVPVPESKLAFHTGKLDMHVAITDHGPIVSDTVSISSDPVTIDAHAYYKDDLKKWLLRQKDRCASFYRTFLEFRPAEYDMQKRMADLVKEIDPIVSSAEVQRIVYTAEKRTLLNSRRLENTLAECLRNAEEIRDGVASLDNERGAVTRLFEHLQATYAEMMDRNKFPSNESFTYDLLSGKEMDQRRRGMVALRDEVSSGLGRMRNFVAETYPEKLATFDKAMYDIKNAHIPPLKSILCGEYYNPVMDEPVTAYGF
jgi:hypothetical protein